LKKQGKKNYNSFLSFGVVHWEWVGGINLHVISKAVTITDKGNGGRSENKGGGWHAKKKKKKLFYIVAKLNGHFYLYCFGLFISRVTITELLSYRKL